MVRARRRPFHEQSVPLDAWRTCAILPGTGGAPRSHEAVTGLPPLLRPEKRMTSNVGQNYPYSSETEADRAASIASLTTAQAGLADNSPPRRRRSTPRTAGGPGSARRQAAAASCTRRATPTICMPCTSCATGPARRRSSAEFRSVARRQSTRGWGHVLRGRTLASRSCGTLPVVALRATCRSMGGSTLRRCGCGTCGTPCRVPSGRSQRWSRPRPRVVSSGKAGHRAPRGDRAATRSAPNRNPFRLRHRLGLPR